jgi:hypothetical protein
MLANVNNIPNAGRFKEAYRRTRSTLLRSLAARTPANTYVSQADQEGHEGPLIYCSNRTSTYSKLTIYLFYPQKQGCGSGLI